MLQVSRDKRPPAGEACNIRQSISLYEVPISADDYRRNDKTILRNNADQDQDCTKEDEENTLGDDKGAHFQPVRA